MKKILYLALAAVLALSCGGKKNNAHTNTGYILGLSMEDKYSFTIDDEGAFIPVVADPAGAKLASLALVSCNPDDVIDATLTDTGVSITPKKIGSTTLTVQSVANEDIKASCTVAIAAVPAAPKSVAVVKTGSHFIDGNLVLGNGEDFQLEAKVTDVNNAVSSSYKVAWSLVSGEDYIDLSAAGKVTAKANGTATVKVEVENYPAISTTLTVKVLQAPTSISFIYTGEYQPNGNGEVVLKRGKSTSFMINVQPADAIPVVNVSVANSLLINASVSGKTVTVTGVNFTTSATTLTITSPYNSSISKSIKFYVFEYDKKDVKPGDYVYSNGTQVRSADSGLRHINPLVYVDPSTGNIASKPTFPGTSLSGYSGYNYVGVVAKNSLPDDNDFLGCSWLSQCRNGSNATDLTYGAIRNYTKSDLGGFANNSSAHGLVVAANSRNSSLKWQDKTECIGWSNDYKKVDGINIYQSQLRGILAFSKEQRDEFANYKKERGYLDSSNNWVGEYDEHGNPIYDYPYKDCAYVESGLVAHLLMNFYNKHLNNSDYTVLPVDRIDSSTSLKMKLYGSSTKPATTGWFLPGKLEWDIIKYNYTVVNNSLYQASSSSELGASAYWSTEEGGTDYAYVYRPGVPSSYRTEVKKNTTAAVRGVFWL